MNQLLLGLIDTRITSSFISCNELRYLVQQTEKITHFVWFEVLVKATLNTFVVLDVPLHSKLFLSKLRQGMQHKSN
jgi:hypothetical protein